MPSFQSKNERESNEPKTSVLETVKQNYKPLLIAGLGLVAVGFYFRYKVASPSQYLVKTGLGIEDLTIAKKTFVFPFQRYSFLDITPKNYSFNLHAMSSEKMEFALPGVFTIGPEDDVEKLKRFAVRIHDVPIEKMDELILGMIEGETRVLASNLTIEDIFSNRSVFKEQIIKNVQVELDQFGLKIFNANIKELQDTPGSEYFIYLRQKKKEDAINQTKVQVAQSRLIGNLGEKEKDAETRQRTAKIESETIVYENERNKEIRESEATLEKYKAEYQKQINIANIESQKLSQMREVELQREVEKLRLEEEIEKLRANDLSKAKVKAESEIKLAEGRSKATQLEADAFLYTKQRQAEGVLAFLNAQSEGLNRLLQACGGDFNNVMQYLMVDKEVYTKLAETNAKAIQNLNPKITVWNTGNGNDKDAFKPIRDVFQSIPPLVSTIYDQTGIKPASWLVQTPEVQPSEKNTPEIQSTELDTPEVQTFSTVKTNETQGATQVLSKDEIGEALARLTPEEIKEVTKSYLESKAKLAEKRE